MEQYCSSEQNSLLLNQGRLMSNLKPRDLLAKNFWESDTLSPFYFSSKYAMKGLSLVTLPPTVRLNERGLGFIQVLTWDLGSC